MHIFSGRAKLAALAVLLSVSTLSQAQVAKPVAPEGFDQVDADGASLVAPTKTFRTQASDKNFHRTLERWTKDAGWHLSWELDSEYSFSFEGEFEGDLYKAVDGVCASLNSLGVPARAVVYEGNKVIRIVAEGAKR